MLHLQQLIMVRYVLPVMCVSSQTTTILKILVQFVEDIDSFGLDAGRVHVIPTPSLPHFWEPIAYKQGGFHWASSSLAFNI